jgi:hypothetical protein
VDWRILSVRRVDKLAHSLPLPDDLQCALRALKGHPKVSPDPGFYARVIQRIETSRSVSVWTCFKATPVQTFALVFCPVTFLLLALCFYVGTTGIVVPHQDSYPLFDRFMPVTSSVDEKRNAVLMNLVANDTFEADE